MRQWADASCVYSSRVFRQRRFQDGATARAATSQRALAQVSPENKPPFNLTFLIAVKVLIPVIAESPSNQFCAFCYRFAFPDRSLLIQVFKTSGSNHVPSLRIN